MKEQRKPRMREASILHGFLQGQLFRLAFVNVSANLNEKRMIGFSFVFASILILVGDGPSSFFREVM